MEATKVCNTCKRELPATAQYFYRWKHSKDGLRSSCKECHGGNFLIKEKPPEGYRRCSRCKKLLPETEEYFLRYWSKRNSKYYFKSHCLECGKKSCREWRQTGNPEQYREYYHAYHNSEKGREYSREWKRANQEKVKAQKQKYRSDPENREKIRAYDRSRRETPEGKEHANAMTRRWRAENRDTVAEYNRQYVKGHLDYFVQAEHKRNALKRQLPHTLTLQEWEEIKVEFDYKCAYCGKPLRRFTQDHIIPLTAGGGYTRANIIPACKSCNSSKHTTPLEEWYRRQSFFSEERYQRILEHLQEE